MLKLTIFHSANPTGALVRLKKGTKIPFVVKNPMFGDAGLFSYLIKVFRDENDHAFNHVTALDNNKETSFTFKLEVGTDGFAEGDVVITDSNKNTIEFYLKSGNSSVASFLKNTKMNETDIWGDDEENVTFALRGHWPEFKTVSPPFYDTKGKVIVNDPGLFAFGLDDLSKCVYVRHIIDTLTNYLGYRKTNDFLNTIADFNRLAINAGYLKKTKEIKKYLPYVSLLDFLNGFKTRFNIAIIFSPFLKEVDIINIADTLKLTPVDWTDKFISENKISPVAEKKITFSQKAAEDTYTAKPEALDPANVFQVQNYSNLPISYVWGSYVYYVTSLKRWFHQNTIDPENDITKRLSLSKDTENYEGETYYQVKKIYYTENTIEKNNTVTTANTDNLIEQFVFPAQDGEITTSFSLQLFCKSSSVNASLVIKLYLVYGFTEEIIGTYEELVSNSDFQLKRMTFRTVDPVKLSEESNRLVFRLYSKSANAGDTVTIRFGDFDPEILVPIPRNISPLATIDPKFTEIREYGCLADTEVGNNDEYITPIKPAGIIAVNELHSLDGKLVEIPQIEVKDTDDYTERKEYSYLLYRGQLDLDPYYPPGYCNFDVLDINMADYSNELVTPVTPNISLAWRGEKGLLAQLWKNRLVWEQHYKRAAELNLELTYNDIINHKIYQPFSIKSIRYIIDELRFTMDEFGEVDNVKAKSFTL